MADVRTQLVTRVRGMLSEALGATRTRLAAAEADLTASRERLARTRRAAAAVYGNITVGVYAAVARPSVCDGKNRTAVYCYIAV